MNNMPVLFMRKLAVGAVALLVFLFASNTPYASPGEGPAPQSRVDERGWIDVWQLRKDIGRVEMMPRDDKPCYKAPCSYVNRVQFEQASSMLHKTWLPVLFDAVKRGDPVAEAVLCFTPAFSSLRGVVDKDISPLCASTDSQVRRNGPSFLQFEFEVRSGDLNARFTNAREAWRYGMQKDYYEVMLGISPNILEKMKRGDFQSAHTLSLQYGYGNILEIHDRVFDSILLKQRWEKTYHLIQAISANVRRYYIAGGNAVLIMRTGIEDASLPVLPLCVNDYFILSLFRCAVNVSRIESYDKDVYYTFDPRALRDMGIEDADAFKREVHGYLEEIEKNIKADLDRDPRWAAFLIERTLPGKRGKAPTRLILDMAHAPK